MQTARRLYLYLISGVTLAVLAAGLELLAFALLRALGLGGDSIFGGGPSETRVQVSQAVALIAVGLPVWLIHWGLAERGLRPSNPNREAERSSAVRALYLTLVFAVSLLVAVNSAASLLRAIGHSVIGGTQGFSLDDPALALPAMVVSALVWIYHWLVRRRDLGAGPLDGAAAWLPRVYLYGATALGLISAVGGVGELILVAAQRLVPGTVLIDEPSFARGSLIDAASGTVAWAAVWLGHWWYLARTTRGSDAQSVAEAVSRVRLTYLVGIVAYAAAQSVFGLVQGARAVLVVLLGAESVVGVQPGAAAIVRETVAPVIAAAIWTWVAWLHVRWVRHEASAAGDAERPLRVERLISHAFSLLGLAFGASGLAWLLGLAIDVAFGGQRTIPSDDFWRVELAQFVPMAVLGWALWLFGWRDVLARRARDPEGEARSTIRRGALLVTMAGAVLAGVSAAGLVLFRIVAMVLGAEVFGDPVSDLSTPLGVLAVAVAVAGYHGAALRADLAVRAVPAAPAAPTEAAPTEAAALEPTEGVPAPADLAADVPRPRRLVLAGPPGSDLDAVLAGLRASLPADHSLEEAGP